MADPPLAYIKETISVFDAIVKEYLPQTKNLSPLDVSMPVVETHRLVTESDVLRIAIFQPLHPLNIALQEIVPDGYTLVCGTEPCGGFSSRYVVHWSLYSNQNGHSKIIAVLGVENAHVIHKSDFTPAEANAQNIYAKIEKAIFQRDYTLLRQNAIWLSKQAGKYATICDDVAVFDWNAMFIFNYVDSNSTEDGPVRGTYFDESGDSHGMTFSRLLFAFVARALNRYV